MSTSTKKFYRTVIKYEVLSEEPYDAPVSLEQVHYDTTDGHCSGAFLETEHETVDGKRMVELLKAQGSEPEFFMLTPDGEDLEES